MSRLKFIFNNPKIRNLVRDNFSNYRKLTKLKTGISKTTEDVLNEIIAFSKINYLKLEDISEINYLGKESFWFVESKSINKKSLNFLTKYYSTELRNIKIEEILVTYSNHFVKILEK